MPSKLNYSKWDAIELSDDSDIEVHPNVDKKSFIRWKQSDIHGKREARKQRINQLRMELVMNDTLLPRMDSYISATESQGLPFVERTAAELRQSKSQGKPEGSTGPSYDEMMLSLLLQLGESIKKDKIDEADRVPKAVKFLQENRQAMVDRSAEAKKEIAELEEEQKKHITSDDIRTGFDAGHVSHSANTAQPDESKKPKVKAVDQNIETIHDPVAAATSGPSTSGYESDVNALVQSPPVDEDIPDLSPAGRQFIDTPIDKWEKLFACISNHPELLSPKIVDSILMEAFNAAGKDDSSRVMRCVHQALILQYCAKLGSDGVNLFFKRMNSNSQGRKVFLDDVQGTFERITRRSKELRAEHGGADDPHPGQEEAIQLVATDENTQISFNVPSGPPPEHITLEGEGTENLDVNEVKAFLDRQWTIFDSFPKNVKAALSENSLEKVNHCLARMAMDEAEETVQKLQEANILSFSSSEIIDETRK